MISTVCKNILDLHCSHIGKIMFLNNCVVIVTTNQTHCIPRMKVGGGGGYYGFYVVMLPPPLKLFYPDHNFNTFSDISMKLHPCIQIGSKACRFALKNDNSCIHLFSEVMPSVIYFISCPHHNSIIRWNILTTLHTWIDIDPKVCCTQETTTLALLFFHLCPFLIFPPFYPYLFCIQRYWLYTQQICTHSSITTPKYVTFTHFRT